MATGARSGTRVRKAITRPPTKKPRVCKDCIAEGITTKRDADYPGPRCATHHRKRKADERVRRHGQHIEKHFELTEEEYDAILKFQGGVCAICRRAKGIRKKMPVDHNHLTLELRMICCTPCNKMLGHCRDDPEMLRRAADLLETPIIRQFFGAPRYAPRNRSHGWRRNGSRDWDSDSE